VTRPVGVRPGAEKFFNICACRWSRSRRSSRGLRCGPQDHAAREDRHGRRRMPARWSAGSATGEARGEHPDFASRPSWHSTVQPTPTMRSPLCGGGVRSGRALAVADVSRGCEGASPGGDRRIIEHGRPFTRSTIGEPIRSRMPRLPTPCTARAMWSGAAGAARATRSRRSDRRVRCASPDQKSSRTIPQVVPYADSRSRARCHPRGGRRLRLPLLATSCACRTAGGAAGRAHGSLRRPSRPVAREPLSTASRGLRPADGARHRR